MNKIELLEWKKLLNQVVFIIVRTGVAKDINFLAYISPQCSTTNGTIHLNACDHVHKKDCISFFSVKNNSLNFNITGDDPNFSKVDSTEKKSSKDLNKQGNCISLYFLPSSRSNFYRFEATTDKRQTVHFYSKLKNNKYKKKKIKINWSSEFQQSESKGIEKLWIINLNIPFDSIKISHKDLEGSKFLIVKYSYYDSNSNSNPDIINSMALPTYQLENPEKWNLLSDLEIDNATNTEQLQQMVNMENKKYDKERIVSEKNIIARSYVNTLNKAYEILDDNKYDETFKLLERFVNTPSFRSKENHEIDILLKHLEIFIEPICCNTSDNSIEIFSLDPFNLDFVQNDIDTEHLESFINIIDIVIRGTSYWVKKDISEGIKNKKASEGQRLAENKRKKNELRNKQNDEKYLSCFIEILKKEKSGKKFGRKCPPRYTYDTCPRKWPIKFDTFRKKYDKWNKSHEQVKLDNLKSIPCKFKNKCVDYNSEK